MLIKFGFQFLALFARRGEGGGNSGAYRGGGKPPYPPGPSMSLRKIINPVFSTLIKSSSQCLHYQNIKLQTYNQRAV